MKLGRLSGGATPVVAIVILAAALIAATVTAAQYRRAARDATDELSRERTRLRESPEPTTAAPEKAMKPAPVEKPAVTASGTSTPASHQIELQEKVSDLQELLKVKDRMIAELQASPRGPRGDMRRPQNGAGGPADFRNFMENLKQRDPQRYQEMQDRIKASQERMATGLTKQQEFLSQLDTAAMTPDQATNHQKLIELMNQNQEILDAINLDPEAEDVGDLRRQLFDNNRQVHDLMDTERTVALQDLAQRLGYTPQTAGQFVDYVKNVFEVTSAPSFRRGGDRANPPGGTGQQPAGATGQTPAGTGP
ncbi:MAG: hypothetical protein A3K19_12455 [Lentisphaerae bacterium RIFOXYB12_FULL_65_16]|nr:MAG: hypothetical protein A3K18_01760 [Lentisphaerae bacterium RIFOXYA12_64_32]OGV92332.1 MAG: hypothetical protein A3K19_12455 [Lentisphaerae bacterium RIFOXYB12_FULL_65_16]